MADTVNDVEDTPEDPPSDFEFEDIPDSYFEDLVASTEEQIEADHGPLDDLLDENYSDDSGPWSDYIGRQVEVDGKTYTYAGDNMGYSRRDEDGTQWFLTTSQLEDLAAEDEAAKDMFTYSNGKVNWNTIDKDEKLALDQRSQDLKDAQKNYATWLGSRDAYSAAKLTGQDVPKWIDDYYSNWHGQNDYKNLQEFKDMMEQVQGYTDEDKEFFDKALHKDDKWYESLGNAISKAFGGADSITGYTKSGGVADWNGDGKVSLLERVGNTVRNIVTNDGKNLTDFNGDNKVSLLDGLVSGLWNVGQKALNLGGNLVLPGTSIGDTVLGSLHGITTDDYGRKNTVGEALKEYASNFGKGLKEDAIGVLGTGGVNSAVDSLLGLNTGVDWLGHGSTLLEKGANALKDYSLGKLSNDIYKSFEDMTSGSDSDDYSSATTSNISSSGTSQLSESDVERLKETMTNGYGQTRYDSKRAEWKAKHGDPETAVAVSDERLKSFVVSGFLGMDRRAELLRKAMLLEAFGGHGPQI